MCLFVGLRFAKGPEVFMNSYGRWEVVRDFSSRSLPAALVCKLHEAVPSAQRETPRKDSVDQTGK